MILFNWEWLDRMENDPVFALIINEFKLLRIMQLDAQDKFGYSE